MGWSMGGMIAQAFAVRHPDLLRRLVLMATAPGDGKATLPRADAFTSLQEAADATKLLGLLFPAGHAEDTTRYVAGHLQRKGFAARRAQGGRPAPVRGHDAVDRRRDARRQEGQGPAACRCSSRAR